MMTLGVLHREALTLRRGRCKDSMGRVPETTDPGFQEVIDAESTRINAMIQERGGRT